MFKKFYPDVYVENAYDIPYEDLYAQGYRGVIFDVDNTLVPHGAPVTAACKNLFRSLQEMGYETCILSNNNEKRVAPLGRACGSRYVSHAAKPLKKNYIRAMQMMETDSETTLFIGDQLFTDVRGAKKCGIFSVLVKPIHPKEEIQIVIKRFFEKIVLRSYRKHDGKMGF